MSVSWNEAAALRRILAFTSAPPKAAAWAELATSGRLFGAAATFFLLDQEPQHDVETFVVYTLGRLLQHLSRRREANEIQYHGRVRGRVLWPTTFKARFAQDYDPTRYVCREVRYQYDTPENQLLKFVIERVSQCMQGIPDELRSGVYIDLSRYDLAPTPIATRVVAMETALARLRRNLYLREVSVPQQVTELHKVRAETAKMDEYRTVLRFFHHYEDGVAVPSQEYVYSVGKRVLPLPRDMNDRSRIWFHLGADILRA
jgi:hypothetical protein